MNSGIYEIVNTATGHRYIGQAADIVRRLKGHRSLLGRGADSKYLQRAWDKYGEAAFEFNVLGLCARDRDTLAFFEQMWFDARPHEYNFAPVAGSSLGIVRTEETREKIRQIRTGTVSTPEARAKISNSLIGNQYALGKNLGNQYGAPKGRPIAPDVLAARIGQKRTSETRAKMSMASAARWARERMQVPVQHF